MSEKVVETKKGRKQLKSISNSQTIGWIKEPYSWAEDDSQDSQNSQQKKMTRRQLEVCSDKVELLQYV